MGAIISKDSLVLFQAEIEVMGGAERSLLALCKGLTKAGVAHHVVTYEDHIGLSRHADHAVSVVELKPEMRARKKVGALRRYFAGRQRFPAPLLCGYQSAMHGTLAGLRGFHCLMHDTPDLFAVPSETRLKGRTRLWLSNRVLTKGLRSGGQTIVTSEYLRAECRKLFGVEAEIARMGGLESGDAFRLRPVEGTLRMLSVSRLESNKRIDWMLRALATMEQEGLSQRVDWALDVAGQGTQMELLQKVAASLGIAERVNFLGFVDDATLQNTYAAAHLFLMPAVQGYGIPAIEALGRGLPVLLHRESGVSDILLDTPWATVIEGGEEAMLPGLRRAVEGVVAGEQLVIPMPALPSEDAWAERVVELCGWMPA